MAFTKAKVIMIQSELNAALEALAKKHGLTVSPARIKWNDGEITATTMFGDKKDGDADPVLKRDIQRYGWAFGLTEAHIGKTFQSAKGTMVVQGMRASKVIAQSPDGKQWKYDAEVVAKLLDVKRPALTGTLAEIAMPGPRG